jgi:hypothetical protein
MHSNFKVSGQSDVAGEKLIRMPKTLILFQHIESKCPVFCFVVTIKIYMLVNIDPRRLH